VDVRVLIIDDASSDDTAKVAARLAASGSRVEFRQHESNKGHIATYNEGLISWSTGDYVVLLSADDMLTPGSLSRAVQVMEDNQSVGMVYGRAIHFEDEADLPEIRATKFRYSMWSGADWIEKRCRSGHNVISSPEVVVRGSVQRSVGGYRPELPHAGDLEMWLRIAAVSDIAYIKRIPQAFYRVHAKSMLRTKYRAQIADLVQRRAAFDHFFAHHQGIVRNVEELAGRTHRVLAREALWDACRGYDHNRVQDVAAGDLIEFAMNTYPQTNLLPEYRALRRRQKIGAILCNKTQLFLATAVARRVGAWIRRQRWRTQGV